MSGVFDIVRIKEIAREAKEKRVLELAEIAKREAKLEAERQKRLAQAARQWAQQTIVALLPKVEELAKLGETTCRVGDAVAPRDRDDLKCQALIAMLGDLGFRAFFSPSESGSTDHETTQFFPECYYITADWS